MSNKLLDIFDPNSEYNKQIDNKIKQFKCKMKEDKHCSYCVNSHEEPHYEMGYYGGTDTYCDIYHKLMLSYPTGQECLFWRLKNNET